MNPMKNDIRDSSLDRQRKASVRPAVVVCLALLVSLMLLAKWGTAIVEAAGGDLDSTFNASVLEGGAVNALALQPDGKTIIGGSFTTVNGTTRSRIARL